MCGKTPSNWSRRSVLTTGAVGMLALAGCVSEDDPDGDDEADSGGSDEENGETEPERQSPAEVAAAFFEAFERGDIEGMNAHVHPEAEEAPIEDEGGLEEVTFEDIDPKTVEQGDSEATVEVLLTLDPPEGEPVTQAGFVEARLEDDTWLLWDLAAEFDGDGTRVPIVQFDVDRVDGEVEIVHEDGDRIRADHLSIDGEGIARTGTWMELGGEATAEVDGHPAIQEGDTLSIESEESFTVRAVWDDGEYASAIFTQSVSVASDEERVEPPTDEGVEAYLAETDNFTGEIVDLTGADEVTVGVGEDEEGELLVFDPPAIRVDPGTTVVWEVQTAAHSITSVDETFDSGIVEEGESWEYTFESPGEYLYFCKPHRAIDMRGAVVVEEE